MATIPARISAARGYFDGAQSDGLEEVDLPEVEFGTTEIGNMAVAGAVEVVDPADLMAMSATFKFRALSPDVARALAPGQSVEVDVRIAVSDRDAATGAVASRGNRAVLRCEAKKLTLPTIKRAQEDLLEVEVSVSYYRLVIDGVTLVEVDPLNFICVTDGVDRLAGLRSIL